ncbi:hypothetical protein LF817_19920 [Halobacillus sp. A1]|uniref:AbiU2 domain-containing protein n=1 Tax=Halobacillus sp. A1 TaxID=2880262 RepID=UPI0020A66788|nr:hypothetical protein [Halobacillus sp. A1]MCP3033591.1 hypothetical protein [Halobacillus sp. A1]
MHSANTIIKHFEAYKEALFQEIITLNSFLELYVHIRKRRNDRLEILNKSPAFFQLVQESLLSSVIIGIAKIYEKRNRKGRTIFNFLNFISANYQVIFNKPAKEKGKTSDEITEQLFEYQLVQLTNQEPLLNRVFAWRDGSFAHADKKYFEDRNILGGEFPITISDLRFLIELVAEILNKYEGAYNNNYQSIIATNVTDIDNILDWLYKVEPYKSDINKMVREQAYNRH